MTQLATVEQAQAREVTAVATTPAALLSIAVSQGADLAKLEKLMDLQERWEKNEARKAYVAAMSAFKANPPEIVKDKHVSFQTSKGKTEYDHSSIGHVVEAITKSLGEHGLSHRWDMEQQDGGRIKVSCVMTHVLGHSESTSLLAGADDSGGKNNIQAIGSTITYLQRYTLLAATGLASKDQEEDDDGRGTEQITRIDESQLANLRALIEETKASEAKVCAYFKIDKLTDLNVAALPDAVRLLEDRRKQPAEPKK